MIGKSCFCISWKRKIRAQMPVCAQLVQRTWHEWHFISRGPLGFSSWELAVARTTRPAGARVGKGKAHWGVCVHHPVWCHGVVRWLLVARGVLAVPVGPRTNSQ